MWPKNVYEVYVHDARLLILWYEIVTVVVILAEESFSESLRKEIEGRIALITNGHGSDYDTADTASMTSTIGEDAPVNERQKVRLLLIAATAKLIYYYNGLYSWGGFL